VAKHARKTLVASRRAVTVRLNEVAPCSDGRCKPICPASGPDRAKPLVVPIAQVHATRSAKTTVARLQACYNTRYCTCIMSCIMSGHSARPTPRANRTPPETSYLSTTAQAIISYQITKDDIVVRPNRQQQFRHTCIMSIPAPEISHV
jgi:hypothetical protein